MEFYYSSDEEINVAYYKYQHTPYTDPSVVKKLWREHFSLKPKKRNREVTRAFEMKCSLYQFIHPELSRDEVRTKAMDDIGIRSTANKKSKKHLENSFEILQTRTEEKHDDCLEKPSKSQNKKPKSKKLVIFEFQGKNNISNLSKSEKNYQKLLQKPLKPKKLKLPKKVLEKGRIETSLISCPNINSNLKSHMKNIEPSGIESSYFSKITTDGSIITENSKICTNDVLSTARAEALTKKPTVTEINKICVRNESIKKVDTHDKSLQEKNSCVKTYIKTETANNNEINVVKMPKKLQKNKKIAGQENMRVIKATIPMVSQGHSSSVIFKPNNWKKCKFPYDPLQNLTSLGIIKHEKAGSNKGKTDCVNSKTQKNS